MEVLWFVNNVRDDDDNDEMRKNAQNNVTVPVAVDDIVVIIIPGLSRNNYPNWYYYIYPNSLLKELIVPSLQLLLLIRC
jgi:hypothetical protein